MKQVTRYESDDGVLFDTEEACKRHEHKQQVIKKIREGIDSACIAEDVFDFVVNNIELFCVPAGTVSSIHNGVIASTYSVWYHGSDVAVKEGTKFLQRITPSSGVAGSKLELADSSTIGCNFLLHYFW